MNTRKLEKWLLLEQSGELSPRQALRLNRALEASEEARVLKSELVRLKGSIRTPNVELAPWTVAKISARLNGHHRPVLNFYRGCHSLRSLPRIRGASLASLGWKPALALAACLAVVAGVLNFHGKQIPSTSTAVVVAAGADVWNDPFEEDLSKLENLIVAISGDPLDIMEM